MARIQTVGPGDNVGIQEGPSDRSGIWGALQGFKTGLGLPGVNFTQDNPPAKLPSSMKGGNVWVMVLGLQATGCLWDTFMRARLLDTGTGSSSRSVHV